MTLQKVNKAPTHSGLRVHSHSRRYTQVEELTQARDTAAAECEALAAKLSDAQSGTVAPTVCDPATP
jgi:hypothetical protein